MALTSAIRRTTITTNDMEASLGFYRDILGFDVWYDDVVDDPVVVRLLGVDPGVSVRVAILEAEPGDAGKIGLMHFIGQKALKKELQDGPPAAGETIILFKTLAMMTIRKKLLDAGHAVGDATEIKIPGRPTTYEMAMRDPNGVRLTLVQFNTLDEPTL